mmetsp:Transcript_12554/g.35640  ORF Transcript_12554/g.35640 Transcript_12554/m.35640 type:complete len:118 (+) Transcript_12554:1032-1385(+)
MVPSLVIRRALSMMSSRNSSVGWLISHYGESTCKKIVSRLAQGWLATKLVVQTMSLSIGLLSSCCVLVVVLFQGCLSDDLNSQRSNFLSFSFQNTSLRTKHGMLLVNPTDGLLPRCV